MNNLKKQNYLQLTDFINKNTSANLIVTLHMNYENAYLIQSFFSTCKENKINMFKFKLNFIRFRLTNKKFSSLVNGPTIFAIMSIDKYIEFQKILKSYNFCVILSLFYKNKFIKPTLINEKLNNIKTLTTKLSITSNLMSLFFFKRLISLFTLTGTKPLVYLIRLLKLKCQL